MEETLDVTIGTQTNLDVLDINVMTIEVATQIELLVLIDRTTQIDPLPPYTPLIVDATI